MVEPQGVASPSNGNQVGGILNVHGILAAGVYIIIGIERRSGISRGRVGRLPTHDGGIGNARHGQVFWRGWRNGVLPRHGRHKRKPAVEHLAREIVDALRVVYEKLGTEESVSLSQVAQVIHLPGDILYAPLTLAGMQEIDAQSRSHHAALGLLLPVDGERIELVAPEIHHGVKLVHQAFLEPSAGILEHAGVGVPASTLVTA